MSRVDWRRFQSPRTPLRDRVAGCHARVSRSGHREVVGSKLGGCIFIEVVGWVTPVIPLRKFRQHSVARRRSGVLLVLYYTITLYYKSARTGVGGGHSVGGLGYLTTFLTAVHALWEGRGQSMVVWPRPIN